MNCIFYIYESEFPFINHICKDLYSPDNGRPAIEPELLFKMLLLGYLYDIKSEVKIAQAVNENIAFKWFLGLKLTEKGRAKAEDVYGRHKLLTSFLQKITGLPEDQCEENACRVEHQVDADVVDGIRKWLEANS